MSEGFLGKPPPLGAVLDLESLSFTLPEEAKASPRIRLTRVRIGERREEELNGLVPSFVPGVLDD